MHVRYVPQRLPGDVVVAVGDDQDSWRAARRALEIESPGQHGHGVLGPGHVTVDEAADDQDPAVAEPVRQRAAQGRGLHLLRRPLHVGTRHRAVRRAAAGVLGRAERALAGPAGALLPVGLLTAAADLAAGLGRVGALPGRGLLGHHDLVDQRHVHLGGEDRLGQVDRLVALAGRRDDADCGHQASPPRSEGVRTALRTRTTRPLGPGTAPLIRSSPRSASTECTVSDCTVVRTPPIRPAIRTPLNTRPGVAQAPMDPGERCLRWVPCAAPRPRKPCLFMTPAVPLPLLRPVTSTCCPLANTSAVTSCPSVYSDASSVRSSARYRRGVRPAFSNTPLTGLVTLRGSISP